MSGASICLGATQAQDTIDVLLKIGHELKKPPRVVGVRQREEWELLGCQAIILAYRIRDKVEAHKRGMVPA